MWDNSGQEKFRDVGTSFYRGAGARFFFSHCILFYFSVSFKKSINVLMLVLVFVQDACVLVYDITNADSFKNIKMWHKTFLKNAQLSSNTKCPFLLCGNKSDLQSARVVSQQDGESLANQLGMLFAETSALDGDHFGIAMRELINVACAVDTDNQLQEQATINIDFELTETRKRVCCFF
ncbi:rab family small GTPase [Reticulomyxa filosa]|uniref:Rab family small GTPase n=1 Tax=Reticulomyxa filosa TaxID=46433 RepID=X6MLT2_RETFI|nr:rab family small GTPase [Reticulomyxa filosa]|eukprot:ETO14372.1 rab family small GTPase [Reticulomyxa filosa]